MATAGHASEAPRRGQACPSDFDVQLAFKPGFDSRFTFGTMIGCSGILGILVVAALMVGPPTLVGESRGSHAQFAPMFPDALATEPPFKIHSDVGSLAAESASLPLWGKCEGYWPDVDVCLPLGMSARPFEEGDSEDSRGCPQRRIVPGWVGKDAFLAKLNVMQGLVVELSLMEQGLRPKCKVDRGPAVRVLSFRGLAFSRVKQGLAVGSKEFSHTVDKEVICWPDGWGKHYVEQHDVIPSARFQEYVSQFDLDALNHTVELSRACRDDGASSEL